MLFFIHRGEQFGHHDSGSGPVYIHDRGGGDCGDARDHRCSSNLVNLFTIIGASFGPICGAMVADYWLSRKKWAGPREGVNVAGYGAWAIGFVIGILPFLPIPEDTKPYLQPAAVYSFVAGFLVYVILAKAGLEPKVVPARIADLPPNVAVKV